MLPEDGEQRLFFWVAANTGDTSFRLTGPDGRLLISWAARQGEISLTQHLPSGKYLIEIEPRSVDDGQVIFAAKGHVIRVAGLDPKRVHEYPPLPANGFHWPYLLFVPKTVRFPCIVVVPNNTGFPTEDLEILRASASNQVASESPLAERLGCPLLVPLFPRPPIGESNLYLHALTRDALTTTEYAWKRVDLQLLQMIDAARSKLKAEGVETDKRVLLYGFSAAGSFVNRFAMLHPERVLAVAGGGISWPIAPVRELDGERLRYPVGIEDLETFTGKPADPAAWRAVTWFLFRGAEDDNDPVDFQDCYSPADSELIRRRFGTKPAVRWTQAERLYAAAGLKARLILYPRAGHTDAPAREDVARFFEQRLAEVF